MERPTKRQKADIEPLSCVLSQIICAHRLLRELHTKNTTINQSLLSQIVYELKSFAVTMKAVQSKTFDWTPLLQMNTTHWLHFFSAADWLALASCNSKMFALLSPLISTNFPFRQACFSFTRYNPTTLKNVTTLPPNAVSHIHFASDFNQPLPPLPPHVTHLFFGAKFNQNIINPPPSVISIEIPSNSCFHKSLNFPPLLTHLTLPNYYDSKLPVTLTHLSISHYCSPSLIYPLHNLKVLKGCHFKTWLTNLPQHLEILDVNFCSNQPLDILPTSLKNLSIEGNFDTLDNLPQNLTHLILPSKFTQPITTFPSSLLHLTFGTLFNHPIDNLPPFITHLTLGYTFNQPIDSLPSKITHLTLGYDFNQPINNLPLSITHLFLGLTFNHPLDKLPPSILHLKVGAGCEYPVTNATPRLSHLTVDNGLLLGHAWKFPLNMGTFPNAITHLCLGYNHPPIVTFPPLLTHLLCDYTSRVDIQMFTHLPHTLTNLQCSPDSMQLLPQNHADALKVPALECFNLSTYCSNGALHYQVGANTKFKFEVYKCNCVKYGPAESLAIQFYVNFNTHEIYIYYDL